LPVFEGGPHRRVLEIRRSPNARRMRLAVDPRDGVVRLTLPRRAAIGPAIDWAETQRGWVEAALAKLPVARPIVAEGRFPFEGEDLLVDWRADRPRTIRREDGRLVVGGPEEGLEQRVLRWARREALAVLAEETRFFATKAGVTIGRIGVGDARSRWGSCASNGDIRYSWRLILAPPAVRQATVAHEVAHRLHMDHSPAFHAAVKRLLGRDPAPERRWLKTEGAALYWVGCGS